MIVRTSADLVLGRQWALNRAVGRGDGIHHLADSRRLSLLAFEGSDLWLRKLISATTQSVDKRLACARFRQVLLEARIKRLGELPCGPFPKSGKTGVPGPQTK